MRESKVCGKKIIPGPLLKSDRQTETQNAFFLTPEILRPPLCVFPPNALGRKGHKKSNPRDFVGIGFFVGGEEVGRVKNLGAFVSSVFLFLFQIRITCFAWIVATKTKKNFSVSRCPEKTTNMRQFPKLSQLVKVNLILSPFPLQY